MEEEFTPKYLWSKTYEYGVHFYSDYCLSCQAKDQCLCKRGGKRAAQTHVLVLQSEAEQRRTGGGVGRDFLPWGCMSLEVSCQIF